MPEQHDPEQELGPKIADCVPGPRRRPGDGATGMAREARRRVHRRRQAMSMAAVRLLVVAAVGGVWGLLGGASPVATSRSDSASEGGCRAGGEAFTRHRAEHPV